MANILDVLQGVPGAAGGPLQPGAGAETGPTVQSMNKEMTSPFRMAMQGLSFGSADEAEAFLRSLVTKEDYDKIVADIRKDLATHREFAPGQAAALEIGGAMIPAVASMFATGGASTPLLAAAIKAGLAGAAGGGIYSFNADEGAIVDRMKNWRQHGKAAGVGGITGGVSVPILKGAGRGIGWLLGKMPDVTGTASQRTMEKYLRKYMEETGLSEEDLVQGVMEGRILAENKTLQQLARTARIKAGGPGKQVMSEAFEGRPEKMRSDLENYLTSTLDPKGKGSLAAFRGEIKGRKSATGDIYDRIFSEGQEVGPTVSAAAADTLRRDPTLAKEAARLYRLTTGKKPYFDIDDAGEITFNRAPTLEEAEIMRRATDSAATKAYRGGEGAAGEALADLEKNLRGTMDAEAGDLAQTRSQWRQIETEEKAFDLGRKASSSNDVGQTELDLLTLQEKGDPALIEAYQRGMMTGFKNKFQQGGRAPAALTAGIAGGKEGAAINRVLDPELADQIAMLADNAVETQGAKNTILGGSQTAETIMDPGTTDGGILDLVADGVGLASGGGMPVQSMLRGASRLVADNAPTMGPAEHLKLAQLLVETDPQLVQRALQGDRGAIQRLVGFIKDTTRGQLPNVHSGATGAGAGGVGGGVLPLFYDE